MVKECIAQIAGLRTKFRGSFKHISWVIFCILPNYYPNVFNGIILYYSILTFQVFFMAEYYTLVTVDRRQKAK